jgi:hypothetical protein
MPCLDTPYTNKISTMRINLTCRNELMHRLDKKKYFAQFDVFFNYGDSSVAKCEQSVTWFQTSVLAWLWKLHVN